MMLWFVRHTKTVSPEGVCYGYSDVLPDPSFENEKKRIIKEIEEISFAQTFSSPLTRCTMLATSISTDVIIDERLKEMDFGAWEGKTWEYIYQTSEGKAWFADYKNVPCPNGESFNDLQMRVKNFLKDLKKYPAHTDILIVTHAGVIRAFLTIIHNISVYKAFDIKIAYGEIVKIPYPVC